jgi:hypothetical protein
MDPDLPGMVGMRATKACSATIMAERPERGCKTQPMRVAGFLSAASCLPPFQQACNEAMSGQDTLR